MKVWERCIFFLFHFLEYNISRAVKSENTTNWLRKQLALPNVESLLDPFIHNSSLLSLLLIVFFVYLYQALFLRILMSNEQVSTPLEYSTKQRSCDAWRCSQGERPASTTPVLPPRPCTPHPTPRRLQFSSTVDYKILLTKCL